MEDPTMKNIRGRNPEDLPPDLNTGGWRPSTAAGGGEASSGNETSSSGAGAGGSGGDGGAAGETGSSEA